MPIHSAASWLGHYDLANTAAVVLACTVLWALKSWLGGRQNTWERDWAGKMILVVVSRAARVVCEVVKRAGGVGQREEMGRRWGWYGRGNAG
jgi:hypothetical protein